MTKIQIEWTDKNEVKWNKVIIAKQLSNNVQSLQISFQSQIVTFCINNWCRQKCKNRYEEVSRFDQSTSVRFSS